MNTVQSKHRRLAHALITGVLALMLVGVFAEPAHAHVRFFFGLGFPIFPYVSVPVPPPPVVAYPAPYPYPAYGGYAYIGPRAVPPRAWVRGHWGWRHDGWGRRHRVWMPAHLR